MKGPADPEGPVSGLAPADDAIAFGSRFVGSDRFRTVFREGMGLVEQTAAYLDGQGRKDARALPRDASLAYASESMRLTTRLMQLAAWLLVRRAVNEGEITPLQAEEGNNRVNLRQSSQPAPDPDNEALPERLRDLIVLSDRLHARILRLDAALKDEQAPASAQSASPVDAHLARLQQAFSGGRA